MRYLVHRGESTINLQLDLQAQLDRRFGGRRAPGSTTAATWRCSTLLCLTWWSVTFGAMNTAVPDRDIPDDLRVQQRGDLLDAAVCVRLVRTGRLPRNIHPPRLSPIRALRSNCPCEAVRRHEDRLRRCEHSDLAQAPSSRA
jgi:hypothetical protein